MKIHELKTVNPHFENVWDGIKPFEVRKNDRDYKVVDVLHLREYYKPTSDVGITRHPNGYYPGREILAEITYILADEDYVKEGFVVIGIKILKKVGD